MARKFWAGLDVGVETTSVCVINDFGEVLHEATCPTDVRSVHREIVFLKRRRFARVSMETGMGIHLARGLRSLGYSVDVYEARQLSKFLRARRNKTDAGDANGIAEAGRVGATRISKVHLKSLEYQFLASRLAIRSHMIRTRVRAATLLYRQLELFGGRIRSRAMSGLLRTRVEAEIKKLFGKAPNPLVAELRHLLGLCERLITYQVQMDRELKRLASEIEVCRRFMDIPGIGPICALTFYAAVSEPHRFSRSADIGAYLGLTPKLHESGLTKRAGRISKMGSVPTRTLLVRASTQFMKSSDAATPLRSWALQVEQRRGRGRARVALARKLATIMLAMWKSGKAYHPKPANCEASSQPWEPAGLDPVDPNAHESALLVAGPGLCTSPEIGVDNCPCAIAPEDTKITPELNLGE
jgi:transposase